MRLARWAAVLIALCAAGAGVYLLARSQGQPAAVGGDPHAMAASVSPAEADRVLRAAAVPEADASQAALVAEGRRLFRSTELAKAGESCQSCHTDGGGVNPDIGTIVHPQEPGDFSGPRDVPSLWNIADTAPYGWDGRQPDLAAFVVGTIVSHFRAGASQSDARTAEQTRALVAYLGTLKAPTTAFDRGRLSAAARRGQSIFVGKGGCIGCHIGPSFTDGALHDLGVQQAAGDDDTGAAPSGPLLRAFNTSQLRDVGSTAPYMHNGSLRTLADVVRFYSDESAIAPLGLTEPEVADLVAYLESL